MTRRKGKPISVSGRLRAFAPLALVALAAVGCGGTAIDSQTMEEEVRAYLENSLHEDVKSIDCPSGEPVDPGLIVKCDVGLAGGAKKVVGVEIVNEDADIHVVSYRSNE